MTMRTIGIFKTKTHLPSLIKEVEGGEEICVTNRGKKVAFIIPVSKYYNENIEDIFNKLSMLKMRAPLGNNNDILEMKNFGKK